MKLEMRSPVGKRSLLQKTTLEDGLVAHLPALELGSCVVETETQAKLCPETSTIMMRCKVGNGFDFYIDRSKTGGIWLDVGEWEALRNRNFHDEIHLIFTEPWQQEVRDWEAQQVTQKILHDKLGDELLSKLDQLKSSLVTHPHKAYAIAYLEQ